MRYNRGMNEPMRQVSDEVLNSKGYELYQGWNDKLAHALVQKSMEAIMLQNVPGDRGRRFSNEAAAHQWMADAPERLLYALYANDDLAGVLWFSPQADTKSTAQYTFAVRLYASARGKSLGLPFMQATHADAAARGIDGVWLETDESNAAARALYTKFGYQTTAIADGRVHMYI